MIGLGANWRSPQLPRADPLPALSPTSEAIANEQANKRVRTKAHGSRHSSKEEAPSQKYLGGTLASKMNSKVEFVIEAAEKSPQPQRLNFKTTPPSNEAEGDCVGEGRLSVSISQRSEGESSFYDGMESMVSSIAHSDDEQVSVVG